MVKINLNNLKKIFAFAGVFLFGVSAHAFPKDTLNRTDYTNFVHLKEFWICTSVAFPIDLSLNAFEVNYTPKTGRYFQIEPGSHKDGSLPVSGTRVSGIFNVTGRQAGIYEFVYISDVNDFCGMGLGDKSLVRLYLVPELKDFSLLVNICPDHDFTVDLTDYLPYEIKNFADSVGWKIFFTETVRASRSTIGSKTYTYSIDDGSGQFRGKFNSMKRNYSCRSQAVATVNVKIVQDEIIIPPREVSFCIENLLTYNETSSFFTVNLGSLLGVVVKDGKWESVLQGYAEITDDDAGIAKINVGLINLTNQTMPFPVMFNYRYKNCNDEDRTTSVTVMLEGDLVSKISGGDTSVACRNFGSGIINLELFYGFAVPATSGVWIDMQKKIKDDMNSEMKTPEVDLMLLEPGSVYNYRYMINPTSVNLCGTGMSGTEIIWADYYLRVRDAEVLSSEAKICKSLYGTGVNINLQNYVAGLDTTQVYWTLNGTPINNPREYRLQGTADTTLKFDFSYVAGECGVSRGSLYLSTTDSIATTDKVIQVCFTDDYAKNINLFQVLGIAGLEGRFEVDSTVPTKDLIASEAFDGHSILNAYKAFDIDNSVERYTFKYVPSSTGITDNESSCVRGELKVTVIVTKHVQ